MGLDVHARSVNACAIDTATGKLVRDTLTMDEGAVLAWVKGLSGSVRVAYEAGPTRFGLAGSVRAGLECLVAAPSKLIRRPGTG